MAHQRFISQEEGVKFEEKGTQIPANVPIHVAIAHHVWEEAEKVNCPKCLDSKFHALQFIPAKKHVTDTEDWLTWVFCFQVHQDDADGAAKSPHSGWFAVLDKVPKMTRQSKDGKIVRVPVGEGWSDDPEDEQ